MSADRFLLDTFYVEALLNSRDDYHQQAREYLPLLRDARELLVTEAVLTEVANALSAINREGAVAFIKQCYQTSNITVVSVDSSLLLSALSLYDARPDKHWGLTDCISFVVMSQHSITDALTADRHFEQAGFRVLLAE